MLVEQRDNVKINVNYQKICKFIIDWTDKSMDTIDQKQ